MKSFLATTAILLALGGTVHAAPVQFNVQQAATDMRASKLIGQTVYSSGTDVDANKTVNADANKDWDNIGEINEIVLGRDGAVKAVVIGVGGFLGMGEKNVAVSLKDIGFVKNGDSPSDYFLVVNSSKDALNAAPEYKTADDVQAAANDTGADKSTTASTTADNAVDTTMDDNRTRLSAPMINRDGYQTAQASELTADKLQGARVYGPKDEDVGEINRMVLDNKGQVKLYVLDIGGFLGMGEREIAVTPKELNIVRDTKGEDLRVYIDANKDTLKAQPEYKTQ
jgi:hypothetical protein